MPTSYIAFDVLALDGQDLTGMAYAVRRGLLASLGLTRPPTALVPPHYIDLSADVLLEIAREHGLEGLVAKRLASGYRLGRSPNWVKLALRRSCEVVLGGWLPGTGRWAGMLGSVLCGGYESTGDLVYLGRVGSGLSVEDRQVLVDGLAEIEVSVAPFVSPLPHAEVRGARWVEPVVVAELDYRELHVDATTGQRRLRHPSWRGLRVDVRPADVGLPDGRAAPS